MFRTLNLRLLLDMITPVLTKLDRFAASDVARRIFGQPDSTLDIGAVLDDGGILLIDLAAGVVGQDTAALIGSTLMNWIASLLFARQQTVDDGRPPAPPRKVLIVIDEFQSLPGVDYAFMLSELGKYGAQLMMGTQSLGFLEQINAKTRTAWLDNTNTLFVFHCGGDDARTLAAELSITDYNPLTLSQSDIVGLPDYTCYVRSRDGMGGNRSFWCARSVCPKAIRACCVPSRIILVEITAEVPTKPTGSSRWRSRFVAYPISTCRAARAGTPVSQAANPTTPPMKTSRTARPKTTSSSAANPIEPKCAE